MKYGSVLMTLTIMMLSFVWAPVQAMQGDPVVIRGPVGSEQTDVRRGEELYGPITRNDTLWSIAQRVRPHSSVSVTQVMSAIVQANPHAFLENNPNAMESGYMLRIPSLQEIQMINPEAARRHIELGEQLQQSARRLQQTQAQTQQTDSQRLALLSQTQDEARQAIEQVRENYAEEFSELRQRLSRSIENTESVIAANEELRQRIEHINEVLDDIQRNMVAEAEFQRQVRELMEEQQSLRLEQQAGRDIQQSQGLAQQIMASPLALILLAFVPALILIAIASLLLRRRDASAVPTVVEPSPQSNATVENATAAGMVSESEDSQDDFELDEAMAEFDDLDDDEGDDLSALEDEMLVPDEEEDDSIQLDDDMDNMDLSEFDALDGDMDDDFNEATEESSTEQPSETDSPQDTADESAQDEDDSGLSQDDLDALFSGGLDDFDEGDDEVAGGAEDRSNQDSSTDGSEAAQIAAGTESDEPLSSMRDDNDGDEEPAPADLFASDDEDDVDALFDGEDSLNEEDQESDHGFDDDDDDFDFDKMMAQFAEDDDENDGELEDDDIESLLAKSDQLMAEAEAPSAAKADNLNEASDEDELGDELDEQTQAPYDGEAEEIDAEEPLDFDSDEAFTEGGTEASTQDETQPMADIESELVDEQRSDSELTGTDAQDNSFIDIDDIIDEASDEPLDEDEEDEIESKTSAHADQEDNLSAQLDLARAYLEMEEFDEARGAIESVMEQAEGELLSDAKALLSRLPG